MFARLANVPNRARAGAVRHGLGIALGCVLASASFPGMPASEVDPLDLVPFVRPVKAPRFSLEDRHALTHQVPSLGRVTVLNFWATWCPPCVEELPSLQALHEALAAEGLEVVTVASDAGGKAVVEPFVERLGLTLPVLLDPRSAVSGQYGVRDLPATFLVDGQGQVVAAARGVRAWSSQRAIDYLRERIKGLLRPRETTR